MRGCECYVHHLEKKIPIQNGNTYCFAGARQYYENYSSENCRLQGDKKYIYITQFREPETEAYIPLVLGLINEITPCKLKVINNIEYIQFKLLKTYDQSLILLNFIRNLWGAVRADIYNLKSEIYNIHFFKILKSSTEYKDPLQRLTNANLKACELLKIERSAGHSNVHSFKNLKIKTTADLLKYKGTNTLQFLTK